MANVYAIRSRFLHRLMRYCREKREDYEQHMAYVLPMLEDSRFLEWIRSADKIEGATNVCFIFISMAVASLKRIEGQSLGPLGEEEEEEDNDSDDTYSTASKTGPARRRAAAAPYSISSKKPAARQHQHRKQTTAVSVETVVSSSSSSSDSSDDSNHAVSTKTSVKSIITRKMPVKRCAQPPTVPYSPWDLAEKQQPIRQFGQPEQLFIPTVNNSLTVDSNCCNTDTVTTTTTTTTVATPGIDTVGADLTTVEHKPFNVDDVAYLYCTVHGKDSYSSTTIKLLELDEDEDGCVAYIIGTVRYEPLKEGSSEEAKPYRPVVIVYALGMSVDTVYARAERVLATEWSLICTNANVNITEIGAVAAQLSARESPKLKEKLSSIMIQLGCLSE